MEQHEVHTEYTGHDLMDLNGEKIGTITDVRYGEMTAGLTWLVVKTGVLGAKKILVPGDEVRSTPEGLFVSFTKDRVKNAPGVHDQNPLDESEQQNLCAYYGLDYVSSPAVPVEGCVDEQKQSHVA